MGKEKNFPTIDAKEYFGANYALACQDKQASPYGSKVRCGAYYDCRIILGKTESVIFVDESTLVPLTSEYVSSCKYGTSICKPHTTKHYYSIIFRNGSWSAIRVSEKHKANLDKLCTEADMVVSPVKDRVFVVCDGKAPFEAARNLVQHLSSIGYQAHSMDVDDYQYASERNLVPSGKVIIVGHHELSKAVLNDLKTVEEKYGMMYGFDSSVCVLRGSESRLKKERKEFVTYYESSNGIRAHMELAKRYNIPEHCIGRKKLHESQYDLLWIEFVDGEENSLSTFLKLHRPGQKKSSDEICRELSDTPAYANYIDEYRLQRICQELEFYSPKHLPTSYEDNGWIDLYQTRQYNWRIQRYEKQDHCRILGWDDSVIGYGTVDQILCPILEHCHRRKKQDTGAQKDWAICFCGGGAKGAYQIGVWKWLFENNLTEKITGVSGASVGALNSLLFTMGDIEKAARIWRSIESEDIAHKKARWIPFAFSQSRLRSIIEREITNWNDITQTRKTVYSSLTGKNVKVPLSDITQHLIKGVASDETSIKSEYFCWASRTREEIQELVLSSAAIPILFSEHRFEGKNFVDGGLADNVPVRPLVEDGYKNIIIVYLGEEEDGEKNPGFIKSINGLNIDGINFYHILPRTDLGNIIEATPQRTEQRMNHGYRDAELVLGKVFR